MDDIIKLNVDKQDMPCNKANDLISVTDDLLCDVRADISQSRKLSVPIAQLSTLGAGVASLLPAFRTITQTSSVAAEGLYRIPNAVIGDTLKAAKSGNFWPSFKNSNKLAQLQKVDSLQSTTSMVMPIDPATMMMAVALFSIEQQLGNIAEMQKKILSFLEIEKESEIEADIETLLVLDATTGQNGLIQAKSFKESADISGIVLTKLDGTARGGIVFAIADELKLPVKFIGVGESADDLMPFEADVFAEEILK